MLPSGLADTLHFTSLCAFLSLTTPSLARSTQDKLQVREQRETDAFMVFVSDVWLDKPEVQEQILKMLDGYESNAPTAFVFIGNFCSTPYGDHHRVAIQGVYACVPCARACVYR